MASPLPAIRPSMSARDLGYVERRDRQWRHRRQYHQDRGRQPHAQRRRELHRQHDDLRRHAGPLGIGQHRGLERSDGQRPLRRSDTTSGASIATLSGNGTVTLGSKLLTLTSASGFFAGSINGSGGLTLASGSETLSGSNGYSGATLISGAGTLTLTGAGNIAASSETHGQRQLQHCRHHGRRLDPEECRAAARSCWAPRP